jgi:ferrochelatase
VLFTAHSLPERVLVDDPYPDQLRASATAVADAVGLDRWAGWSLCWQSAGRTPEPWRGPDILEVLRDLAATERADGVLVCPQGFVSDHLEVVYDLDIEAQHLADELGLAFARTRVLNADETVLAALADLVVAATPA